MDGPGLDWRSAQMAPLMTALIPQKKIPIMRQSPRSLVVFGFSFFYWPDCWVLLYPDAGVGVAEVAGVGGAGWVWQRGVQQAAVRAAGRGAVRVVALLQTGGGDDIFTWFSLVTTWSCTLVPRQSPALAPPPARTSSWPSPLSLQLLSPLIITY